MSILNFVIGETAIDIYSLIITVITIVAGGGWFINHKQKKQVEKANVGIMELKLKESSFEYYLKRIEDLERRLLVVENENKSLKEEIKKLKSKT